MEDTHFFNSALIWTRTIVLLLSILVVVISLTVYNYNALPVFSLLETEAVESLTGHQIINDMIQDRRLIATLVAAQASIFCPLFLLMSSTSVSIITLSSTDAIWRTVVEQFCQFLMPLGLAMSWIFCITFDQHTHITLVDKYAQQQDRWIQCAVYVANGLEHVIVLVLMLEILTIWASAFKNALTLARSQQRAIRLDEKELEYVGIDYEEDTVLFV
jgi:hypothetical protein